MCEYGFGGKLTKEFPSQFLVDLTDVCNLKCAHCAHSESVQNKTAHWFTSEMNKKIVDEIWDKGKGFINYIRYSGEGEPLLCKNLIEILDYAVKNSGTNVTLTTNGTIMKDNLAKQIMETNLFSIDISIDANTKKTYEKIRRGGIFEDVVENVKYILDYKKQHNKNTKIVVSFVKQPDNDHEAEDFEKFWYDKGVNYVVIRRLHSQANIKKDIAKTLDAVYQERKPCLYLWERLVVKPGGEVCYCPSDITKGSVVSNINNSSISDIWKSEQMELARNAHLSNNFEGFELCGNCPDWKNTRWPHEGRSYADMIEEFNEDTK